MSDCYLFEEVEKEVKGRVAHLIGKTHIYTASFNELERVEAEVMEAVRMVSSNFKVIISAAMAERRSLELAQGISAYWSNATDGTLLLTFDLEKVVLILNIFILAP